MNTRSQSTRTINPRPHTNINVIVNTLKQMSKEVFSQVQAKDVSNKIKDLANLNFYSDRENNVNKIFDLYNVIGVYVENQILESSNKRKRNLNIERFIYAAEILTAQGNYFSAQAIMSGLLGNNISPPINGDKLSILSGKAKKAWEFLYSLYGQTRASNENLIKEMKKSPAKPKLAHIDFAETIITDTNKQLEEIALNISKGNEQLKALKTNLESSQDDIKKNSLMQITQRAFSMQIFKGEEEENFHKNYETQKSKFEVEFENQAAMLQARNTSEYDKSVKLTKDAKASIENKFSQYCVVSSVNVDEKKVSAELKQAIFLARPTLSLQVESTLKENENPTPKKTSINERLKKTFSRLFQPKVMDLPSYEEITPNNVREETIKFTQSYSQIVDALQTKNTNAASNVSAVSAAVVSDVIVPEVPAATVVSADAMQPTAGVGLPSSVSSKKNKEKRNSIITKSVSEQIASQVTSFFEASNPKSPRRQRLGAKIQHSASQTNSPKRLGS